MVEHQARDLEVRRLNPYPSSRIFLLKFEDGMLIQLDAQTEMNETSHSKFQEEKNLSALSAKVLKCKGLNC